MHYCGWAVAALLLRNRILNSPKQSFSLSLSPEAFQRCHYNNDSDSGSSYVYQSYDFGTKQSFESLCLCRSFGLSVFKALSFLLFFCFSYDLVSYHLMILAVLIWNSSNLYRYFHYITRSTSLSTNSMSCFCFLFFIYLLWFSVFICITTSIFSKRW